jgi:serine/threonine protein kinase
MIRFTCSNCGKKLKVKDELAEKKGRCPRCGQPIQVPSLSLPLATAAAQSGCQQSGHLKLSADLIASDNAVCPSIPEAQPLGNRKNLRPGRYDFLAAPQAAGELGRLGHYRIIKVLGTGGMAVVFQAEDLALKRMVALKVMPPTLAISESARKRFLREAQAAAAIDHDHIIAIHQVGEERGLPFFAMQLLKGESLEERLDREPQLPIAEILRIAREISEGLAAAHEKGLVHRDIKPSNIWLEASESGEESANAPEITKSTLGAPPVSFKRVKILDFGLARAVDGNARVTQDGNVVGTPAYMAPEQAGDQTIDARCDLFSLGSVLYRMSTGRQPFDGASTIATLMAVATHDPTPPQELRSDLPRPLSDLIQRLMAKAPADRPPTARAVIDLINEAATYEESAFDAPWVPMQPPKKTRSRRPWWLAAGIACFALLVFLIGWNLLDPKKPKIRAGARETDSPLAKIPSSAPPSSAISATVRKPKSADIVREAAPTAPAVEISAGPDRSAAAWALKIGGKVEIIPQDGGPSIEVTSPPKLPSTPFWVSRINLVGKKEVNNGGLERLRGLTHLETLWLADTGISDAHIGPLQQLSSLQGLNLGKTQVSDKGLELLKNLTGLQYLYLDGTRITDAGLSHLKGLSQLKELHLTWTGISNTGLEHLRGLTGLQVLWLQETRVNDAGLATLERLTNLQSLHLDGTGVSVDGMERLRTALPQCQIIMLELKAARERSR